jgi:hypothetical protein
MMDAIEHNNRERLREFGNSPASEMTIRERIATETLAAIVGVVDPTSEKGLDMCVERAIVLTDKLIKRLNENV